MLTLPREQEKLLQEVICVLNFEGGNKGTTYLRKGEDRLQEELIHEGSETMTHPLNKQKSRVDEGT